jgi:lactate dehydrogenase-like 2-hydroxyacid dehydrogenase
MSRSKIVVMSPVGLQQEDLGVVERESQERLTAYDSDITNEQELLARAEGARVIVIDQRHQYSSAVLRALPSLQLIVTTSTSVQNIDTRYCNKHGIRVESVGDPSQGAATEAAMGYVLALMRGSRIGNELAGSSVVVAGTKPACESMAKLLAPFECSMQQHVPRSGRGPALSQLVTDCDALVVLDVGEWADEPLVGREVVSRMKTGSVLVNLGSWRAVDIFSIAESVHRGQLSGVAIACEPFGKEIDDLAHPLVQELERTPNVIFRPSDHTRTHQSLSRLVQQLSRVLAKSTS